jgi:CheY-like chemotaxis protein
LPTVARHILIADDDDNDRHLFQRALAPLSNTTVHVVSNGVEVIDYLTGQGRYQDRIQYPVPDFLILDIQMPVIDGFGVLQWLRQHAKSIPFQIITFSSEANPLDAQRAYDLGASWCLLKSAELKEMARQLNFIFQQVARQHYLKRDQ